MAWYKTGTISITIGQTSITGVNTKFASNSKVGDGLRAPDGKWYEIVNIASETVLGIFPAYAGPTVSASADWMVAPLQGYNQETARLLRAITDSIPTSLDGKQDKNANLTAMAGLTGVADRLMYYTGPGALALTPLTAKMRGILGRTANADIQSDIGLVPVTTANDVTAGRLVTPGWMGLGTAAGLVLPGANANAAVPAGKYYTVGLWTGSPFTGTDNRNRGYLDVYSWGQDGYQMQEFTPLFYVDTNPKMFRTNLGGTWRPWTTITSGNIAAKDSVTSGEVLTIGQSGWNGGAAIVMGNGVDCNNLVAANMYALNGTYLNGPTFFTGTPLFLRVLVHGSGYETQEAICITAGFKATRRRVNSAWGAWIPDVNMFTATSDPASGSGGIVFSGSNGNGFFTKFADGTLICWQHRTTQATTSVATGAGFQGATGIAYTFPVPFVSTSDVQVIPRATLVSGDSFPWAVASGQSLNGVTIIPASFANNIVTTCGYIAIGRWK